MKKKSTVSNRLMRGLIIILMSVMNFSGFVEFQSVFAAAPGSVSLDKIQTELGGGLYEITLTLTGVPVVKSTDIVLVIDTSASMSGNKIAAAKNAANRFVDTVLGKNEGHRIAIVSFADIPAIKLSFSTNATTLKNTINSLGANGYTHLEGGIYTATQLLKNSGLASNNKAIVVLGDGQPTKGYDFTVTYNGPSTTYIDSRGRCKATVTTANLNNTNNYSGRYNFDTTHHITANTTTMLFNKDIVISGTCSNGATVTSTIQKSYSLEDSVYWQATQAKSLGYAIFSIGLEVNSTGRRVLQGVQNSGYYDSTSTDLPNIYTAIASQIVFAARNAVVTDKIGNNFDFVSIAPGYETLNTSYVTSSKILTWNVGNVGSSALILKYIVKIHNGLPSGQYPTNEYATVTYTDINNHHTEGTFPKPVVVVNNGAPVASGSSFTVGTGKTFTGAVNATDPENNALTYLLVSGPSNGSLTLNPNGTYTYTHNGNASTLDGFTFKANDGFLDSNVAAVTITVTIPAVNRAPVTDPEAISVNEGGTKTDSVTGSDPDGDPLTFSLTESVKHGKLVFNANGTYTYTHDGSETTSDTFNFRVYDGKTYSTVRTATITITLINEAPVTDPEAITVNEGGTKTDSVTGSDPDGDPLTFSLMESVKHGKLVFNANGTYTYTHDGSETTSDTFNFRVYDGKTYSTVRTATITITLINEAPVAKNGTATTAFETAIERNIHNLITDIDTGTWTIRLVTNVTHGTLVLKADGSLVYTPNAGFSGTDRFTFKANDGALDSNIATYTITVNEKVIIILNVAPIANNGSAEIDFETPLTGNIHNLITDTDSTNWTIVLVSNVAHGTLTLNPDGSMTYTPNVGYSGTDGFTFKGNDGKLDSNIATYTITVNEEVVIITPETPLSPLSFWWLYLLGLLALLLFFLRPNLKYALVDKEGNEKVLRRHIFANGKDDLFIDLNDKNVEGLVAVDLVVYKQLVKREQGKKITFNLFKKPAKVIQVPEDKKEKIEDQIRL